jgi:hypothetical protein
VNFALANCGRGLHKAPSKSCLKHDYSVSGLNVSFIDVHYL